MSKPSSIITSSPSTRVLDALRRQHFVTLEGVLASAGLFVTGLLVAFSRIEYRSIWRDEGITLEAISGPWSSFPHRWFRQDFVMGFYFAVTKLWVQLLGGDSPRSLRTISALSVASLVVVCWWTARRLAGYRAAIVAVALLLTSQVVLLAAHDARAYALVALLGSSSYLALIHRFDSTHGLWLFACLSALTAYAHPLGVLAPIGMLAGSYVVADKRTRSRLLRAGCVLGILVSPIAVAQLRARTGLFWLGRPGLRSLEFSAEWLLVGFGPRTAQVLRVAILIFGSVLAITWMLRAWRPANSRRPWSHMRPLTPKEAAVGPHVVASPEARSVTAMSLAALVGWALVPTVTLLVLTYAHEPIFVDRYVLISVPAVLLLASVGLARLPLLPCLVIGATVAMMWSGPAATSMRWQANENWWGAFDASNARRTPSDMVMAGDGWPVMLYYFRLQSKPAPEQAFPVWPTAADARPFARTLVDVEASLKVLPADRTIWLYTFEGEPSDAIGPLGDALETLRRKGYDASFGQVRVRSFLPRPV